MWYPKFAGPTLLMRELLRPGLARREQENQRVPEAAGIGKSVTQSIL
jgi:hypothetical protein